MRTAASDAIRSAIGLGRDGAADGMWERRLRVACDAAGEAHAILSGRGPDAGVPGVLEACALESMRRALACAEAGGVPSAKARILSAYLSSLPGEDPGEAASMRGSEQHAIFLGMVVDAFGEGTHAGGGNTGGERGMRVGEAGDGARESAGGFACGKGCGLLPAGHGGEMEQSLEIVPSGDGLVFSVAERLCVEEGVYEDFVTRSSVSREEARAMAAFLLDFLAQGQDGGPRARPRDGAPLA